MLSHSYLVKIFIVVAIIMALSTQEKVDALEAELRMHEERKSFLSRFDSTQKLFFGIWAAVSLLILVLLAQFQPSFVTVEDDETEEQVLSWMYLLKWFVILSIISGLLVGFGWWKYISKSDLKEAEI